MSTNLGKTMATTWNKPPGLPVLPPHADPRGDCLALRVLEAQSWRGRIQWPAGFEAGIAHRLDNATSGAILLADSLEELAILREHFRLHQFIKTYLLLASVEIPWRQMDCDRPLAHHPRKKNRMVVQRSIDTPHRGKWYPAVTHFQRVRGRLAQAMMRTGVMHQIRAHAGFLGIPLAGDRLYGGGDFDTALPGVPFLLHHVGLSGPEGLQTQPVSLPVWAVTKNAG